MPPSEAGKKIVETYHETGSIQATKLKNTCKSGCAVARQKGNRASRLALVALASRPSRCPWTVTPFHGQRRPGPRGGDTIAYLPPNILASDCVAVYTVADILLSIQGLWAPSFDPLHAIGLYLG